MSKGNKKPKLNNEEIQLLQANAKLKVAKAKLVVAKATYVGAYGVILQMILNFIIELLKVYLSLGK